MPSIQRGQVFKLGGGSWAYRYRDHGRRRQVGGFKTKGEARDALDAALVVARGGPRASERRGWTLSQLVDAYLAQHQVGEHRTATLRWLLRKATDPFGAMLVRDLLPEELGRWAAVAPGGASVRGDAGAAAGASRRRCLGRPRARPRRRPEKPAAASGGGSAVRFLGGGRGGRRRARPLGAPGDLRSRDRTPARGTAPARTPRRRQAGKRPTRSPRLRPRRVEARRQDAGVCPSSGTAEQSRPGRARSRAPASRLAAHLPGFAAATSTCTTGEPANGFRPSALRASTDAEGKATKRIYDLRHTFATFAIHALVPSFIIARVMGTSEAMLRRHYGHLLPDTDELVIERLNAYAASEKEPFGHGVDTAVLTR